MYNITNKQPVILTYWLTPFKEKEALKGFFFFHFSEFLVDKFF